MSSNHKVGNLYYCVYGFITHDTVVEIVKIHGNSNSAKVRVISTNQEHDNKIGEILFDNRRKASIVGSMWDVPLRGLLETRELGKDPNMAFKMRKARH